MKIKLKTTLAGPMGSYQPGDMADFDEQTAKALVDGGYAEALEVGESNGTQDDNTSGDGTNDADRSEAAPESGRKRRR